MSSLPDALPPHPDPMRCTMCGTWLTLDDFVASPDLEPLGLGIIDGSPDLTLYYFTHRLGCGTTLTVPVMSFAPWIREPIPEEFLTGTADCSGFCLDRTEPDECTQPCANAPFRRFLTELKERRGR